MLASRAHDKRQQLNFHGVLCVSVIAALTRRFGSARLEAIDTPYPPAVGIAWQYGSSAFAAVMRKRIGAVSWFTSASSHSSGFCVYGRPCIRLGLLRLPGGLPAPLRRPPHPLRVSVILIVFQGAIFSAREKQWGFRVCLALRFYVAPTHLATSPRSGGPVVVR